jgi:RNA polymerase sigma-70 factor (ECF subfamily)
MDEREKLLIERVLAGDTSSFEPLVTPYRRAVLGLAARIVGDPEDAREVAQDALLRAFQYLRSCDREMSFRNWLFQIAVNAARDFRRRSGEAARRTVEAARGLDGPASENPEARLARTSARERLMDCLDVLSARERDVFLLREIEELDVAETARVLKCSAVSVRVHLNRARTKLRDRIRDRYPDLLGGSL